MKITFILFSAALLLLISSCNEKKPVNQNDYTDPSQFDENLKEANRLLTRSEDDQINDYIMMKGWNMSKTKTGLRYLIYIQGNGIKAENLSIVRFSFRTELINGYVCYDSKTDGYQEIQLGKSAMPGGLEEGLSMMREGDRARFILPSHLAFGLLGDQDKIPAKAILIYDVELLQVRN